LSCQWDHSILYSYVKKSQGIPLFCKNLCTNKEHSFKMEKYLHLKNVQVSLMGKQMTLLWYQGSDLNILRGSEWVKYCQTVYGIHTGSRTEVTLALGKINWDGSTFLSLLKV
jgi:hypothetical protein